MYALDVILDPALVLQGDHATFLIEGFNANAGGTSERNRLAEKQRQSLGPGKFRQLIDLGQQCLPVCWRRPWGISVYLKRRMRTIPHSSKDWNDRPMTVTLSLDILFRIVNIGFNTRKGTAI